MITALKEIKVDGALVPGQVSMDGEIESLDFDVITASGRRIRGGHGGRECFELYKESYPFNPNPSDPVAELESFLVYLKSATVVGEYKIDAIDETHGGEVCLEICVEASATLDHNYAEAWIENSTPNCSQDLWMPHQYTEMLVRRILSTNASASIEKHNALIVEALHLGIPSYELNFVDYCVARGLSFNSAKQ